MEFNGYRSDALGAAVALVNAVAPGSEPQAGRMLGILVEHGYVVGPPGASLEPPLRAWARRLRTVFDAPDGERAAVAVNALLADVTVEPHLSCHDGQPWHLHYSPPQAGVVDRVRSTTAFALAILVAECGTDRHGRCAADGCGRVYADTSRGAGRRYCSPACANRSAVAAHRARTKAGQVASER